jgi:purine nucleosidase
MRCLFTKLFPLILVALAASTSALAQRRLVIIDQDTSGPGGSNMMSMMALLQSPQV